MNFRETTIIDKIFSKNLPVAFSLSDWPELVVKEVFSCHCYLLADGFAISYIWISLNPRFNSTNVGIFHLPRSPGTFFAYKLFISHTTTQFIHFSSKLTAGSNGKITYYFKFT